MSRRTARRRFAVRLRVVTVAAALAAVVALGVALGTATLTGCASSGAGAGAAAQHTPMPIADTPLLAPAAVPNLAVATRELSAQQLAKDASLPDLPSELARDAYVGGRERTFQGPSRRLTFVESRSLVFGSGAAAGSFLRYLHSHASPWFGVGTGVAPLASAGRRGWLFRPAACSCHLANPVLVGVVQDRDHLTWLEINGPAATEALLRALLAPNRSTTA